MQTTIFTIFLKCQIITNYNPFKICSVLVLTEILCLVQWSKYYFYNSMLNSLFSNLNLRNKEDVFKNLAVIKFTPYNNLEPEYK